MTATIRVATETLENVLIVPPQAMFSIDGDDVVYVVGRGARRAPRRRDRSAQRRSRGSSARDCEPGETVALQDPTLEARR